MSEESRLNRLLRINAYERVLTAEEREEAVNLIAGPPDGDECWLCKRPSVGGTRLCADHAYYALVTRK